MNAFNTRKIVTAALAALTLGGAVLATSSPASAWGYRRGYYGYGGGAIAAGVIGGLALGALAASAARPSNCYVVRDRVLTDYGWRSVRRTVCN